MVEITNTHYLFGARAICKYVGRSDYRAIRDMVEKEGLPAYRNGFRWQAKITDLLDWMDENRKKYLSQPDA